jgi:serine/threonine-protein kinase
MTAPSDLLGSLSSTGLLTSQQAEDLTRALPTASRDRAAVGREAADRGWLTAFQAARLAEGREQELVFGPYVLLDLIGEGGMGQVFKARHRRLERLVALKVIRPERLAGADAVRRFQREARAAARVTHPNLVTIYDADEVDGRHFLAMELIDGPDLAAMVADAGPCPPDLACAYLRQACLALQAAHDAGLVHRDVKPSNLLLAGGGTVKLLDLGLALCRQEAEAAPEGLTASGVFLGTPDFVAPEQLDDPHAVDGRADLYALGCTLYFLLSGQVPFPGGGLFNKAFRHRSEEATPIESHRPGLPAGLGPILRRLMAKKPAERFASAAEVAAALGPFCDRAAPPARDPFWAYVLGAALWLIAAGFFGAALENYRHRRQERPPPGVEPAPAAERPPGEPP